MARQQRKPIVLTVICVIVALWLILPTLIVIPISFSASKTFSFPPKGWSLRFYRNLFTSEVWRDSIVNSFTVGLLAAALATVLGTLAAMALVRMRRRWASLLNGFLLTPLIFPGIVVAIAIYGAYLRLGLVGTYLGFVLAHTVLALPFPIVTVTAALRSLDPNYAKAAAGLGATPLRRFMQVTVPLILPSVLSGALFAFMTSFDEIVVGLFIQNSSFRTLPVEMYVSVTSETNPTIAAAATVVIVLSTLAIVGFHASRVVRRKGAARHA